MSAKKYEAKDAARYLVNFGKVMGAICEGLEEMESGKSLLEVAETTTKKIRESVQGDKKDGERKRYDDAIEVKVIDAPSEEEAKP